MAFHIKNLETDRFEHEPAALQGLSLTEAGGLAAEKDLLCTREADAARKARMRAGALTTSPTPTCRTRLVPADKD